MNSAAHDPDAAAASSTHRRDGLLARTVVYSAYACALLGLIAVGIQFVFVAPEQRKAIIAAKHMSQIYVALQHYNANHGAFPPRYVTSADGMPLYSWRLLLLPYLDEGGAYSAAHLDKAWSAGENAFLLARTPESFAPVRDDVPDGHTQFVAVSGEGMFWADDVGVRNVDIRSRAASLVMFVELPEGSVAWTEPSDITVDELLDLIRSPLNDSGPIVVRCMCRDGNVLNLSNASDNQTIRSMLGRDP
jgi:hypothetical protein